LLDLGSEPLEQPDNRKIKMGTKNVYLVANMLPFYQIIGSTTIMDVKRVRLLMEWTRSRGTIEPFLDDQNAGNL
jgi:hypothetical protein